MTAQSTTDITAVVREFIIRLSGTSGIEDDRPLISGGVLDSIAAVQMVDFVERTFGVEVSDEDLELVNFDSVRGLADLVARRVAA
ncbi:acyl carrier protein [Lentzea sp. HUAS12]|uniref:acyl carrier protein n=1 Tax=Lentzea sp. HUAS12 TaxID=2951806 RepID=UPI0020A1F095|nr:acyl carrier protein [Lentzea sp. HUAS12]USX53388.1 acyl carrier protein [Lentzea sp. HUAS12]